MAGNAASHVFDLDCGWETSLSLNGLYSTYRVRLYMDCVESPLLTICSHRYISDVGATPKIKPLFIAMSTVTVVVFDLSFIAERWLRHTGRLAHNTSKGQKVLSVLTIIFAVIGAAGLILLSIFDTLHHHNLHDVFLVLFIGGYIVSAVFICWEYQRLGIHYREHRVLRMSFWVKLAFIFVELGLAVGMFRCRTGYSLCANQ
jgi:hypothetical protein